MFTLTEDVKPLLTELTESAGQDNLQLTLCSSGTGCGGPILKVDMREPLEDDLEEEAGGFTFRIRQNIHKNLEGAVLEAQDTFWGKKIRVRTTYKCL